MFTVVGKSAGKEVLLGLGKQKKSSVLNNSSVLKNISILLDILLYIIYMTKYF